MFLDRKSKISIRDQWARGHAIRGVKQVWNKKRDSILRDLPSGAYEELPGPIEEDYRLPTAPEIKVPSSVTAPSGGYKVCIVGAGAAGLFTGMIFDYLNKVCQAQGFNVTYDIVEAADKSRVGGRLYSYNFVPNPPSNPQGPHDYYDVGAMRFPDNPIMARVFSLFTWLKMTVEDPKSNPPLGSLIPYYMKNTTPSGSGFEPWYYNDISIWGDYTPNDPFQMGGDIPLPVINQPPDTVMENAIAPFRDLLKQDAESNPPGTAGWDYLMTVDYTSTRQFLSMPPPPPPPPPYIPPPPPLTSPPYNYDTIEWMETFNGGTDWYDQAHSETVLESMDFDFPGYPNWYCVLGGAQQLAYRMNNSLQSLPTLMTRVTAIRALGMNQMEVDMVAQNGSAVTNTYAGVFNSTPLGCMKRMDLSKAGLNYSTKQAIRSLGYGASCKIGIKFKRAWWIHDLGNFNITQGGLGHSDLSIRTCVYPSYNLYDPPTQPAVLLCSYTWQQDAERIGALISSAASHSEQLQNEGPLKELFFEDLARLHSNDQIPYEAVLKLIVDNYLDHHAYDWYHDPNAVGSFAFFRPQQFSCMWNKMIQPSGDLVIIGEAASAHHAWVVGALESAVHGVHAWLGLNPHIPGAAAAMAELEGNDPNNPFIGLPAYLEPNTQKWLSYLGFLHRGEHLDKMEKMKTEVVKQG